MEMTFRAFIKKYRLQTAAVLCSMLPEKQSRITVIWNTMKQTSAESYLQLLTAGGTVWISSMRQQNLPGQILFQSEKYA